MSVLLRLESQPALAELRLEDLATHLPNGATYDPSVRDGGKGRGAAAKRRHV